jgi:hypothetical protein
MTCKRILVKPLTGTMEPKQQLPDSLTPRECPTGDLGVSVATAGLAGSPAMGKRT